MTGTSKIAFCIGHRSRILLPLVYTLGILILSSIPDTGRIDSPFDAAMRWVPPQLQNLLHIPVYGGYAASWFWGLAPFVQAFWSRWFCAAGTSFGYGLFDEWYQISIPGRFGSFTDLALNFIGIAIVLVVIALQRIRQVDA